MRESFPGHRVEIVNGSAGPEPVRPFRVTFPEPQAPQQGKKRKVRAPPLPEEHSDDLWRLVRV